MSPQIAYDGKADEAMYNEFVNIVCNYYGKTKSELEGFTATQYGELNFLLYCESSARREPCFPINKETVSILLISFPLYAQIHFINLRNNPGYTRSPPDAGIDHKRT